MSTTSTITHDLPEFPFSPASEARRRLGSLLSSSHFVTTVVSPPPLGPASPHRPPAALPITPSCADQENNADPSRIPPGSSSAEIPLPPPCPQIASVPIETARLQSSKHAPAFEETCPTAAQLSRSNQVQPPCGFKQSPVGQGRSTRVSPRRISAWRRFKRMGNRFVTPLRSMGFCVTSCTGGRRAMACCEDLSSYNTSPGSSWYSSGEYPPEFIRSVLENNALLGEVAVE